MAKMKISKDDIMNISGGYTDKGETLRPSPNRGKDNGNVQENWILSWFKLPMTLLGIIRDKKDKKSGNQTPYNL